MPEYLEWMFSADIALTELVLILIVCRLVLLRFTPGSTFNQLTLLPFYALGGCCIFALAQYYLLAFSEEPVSLSFVFNMGKTFLMYTAISIQTYEWYNSLLMIKFQSKYNITDVHIEKRRFQPMEKKRRNLFVLILAVYLVVPTVFITIYVVHAAEGNQTEKETNAFIIMR
jgi:hypothetical protein